MKLKPLLILIVDDEEDIREILQLWLVAAGHQVKLAASGKQAGQVLKQHKFDLVVTDVLMSDGDGLELIQQMKKAQSEARILAISGGGRYIESDNCLKIARGFGAHAAVLKPFSHAQLLAGVALAMAPPVEPGW